MLKTPLSKRLNSFKEVLEDLQARAETGDWSEKPKNGNGFEARIAQSESELVHLTEQGWKLIRELNSGGKFLMRRPRS